MKTSKSQESGLNKIRSFFEIKRPTKATSPSSISSPPDADEMDENGSGKANGNRLFIRNHKHRNSSRKFRLKTVPTPSTEAEAKVVVKDIREMFENLAVENETKPPGNHSSRLDDNDAQLLKDIEYKEAKIGELWNIGDSDEISQRFIDRRITKEVSELQKLYEQLKVKRRSNGKTPRELKIASFAEAENEVEAEEYRKSLIEQMDQEIANMRAEGFMDADENTIDENNNQEEIESFDDTSQALQRKTNPIDVNGDHDEDLHQPLEQTFLQAYRSRTEAEAETIEEQMEPKPGATADEFGESLEDLESGITVFEAYNDDGRELIEIQLEVHKKTVNPSSGFEVSLEEPQMVFYKENDTYTLLHDTVGDAFETTQTTHRRFFFPTRSTNISRNSSTRSAAYSSASMDSSTFEEDDEGIVVSRNNEDEIYSNVRRLTISDKNGVVRIEREVGPGDAQEEGLDSSVSRSNSTTPARQLEFIMNEIVTTERKYVEDLGKIVNNFKPYIENHTPIHLIGMTGYIFGNIERIYKKQNKFLEALENCGDYIYGIVRCFLGHKSLFDQYQHYFKNKPKSDIVIKNFHETIKDMQDYFKERLELSAYLLTPVQRLGKYILFLENIEKQLFKLNQPTEIVKEALSMMKNEMSKGNDAVAIESIVNSRISKLDYGSFKMREQFSISKPKKMEAMVFLFENVLVFASTDQKNLDTFNYIDSIKMVDLRIATFNDYTIHLTDYTNSKRKKNPTRYTYILEAKTEKIWEMWKTSIENALWQQLEAVKESVSSTPRRFIKNGVNRRVKSTD